MESKRQHVVLFPFMAQGHITPFRLLAELIQAEYHDCTITIVNTPLNMRNLHSSLPPDSKINLKALPFEPTCHGLPPGTETTAALPFHLFVNVAKASETLQPAFERLISDIAREDGAPPLCIIADCFLAWTVDIARKLGIYHSIFNTSGAYGSAVFWSLWRHLPHTQTSDEEFPVPDFPHIRIHRSQLAISLAGADGTDPWCMFLQRQAKLFTKSNAMLLNTVKEFENLGLTMLREEFQIPTRSVGPLLRPSSWQSIEDRLLRWLNSQEQASVLYVSFGSQNTVKASQMTELAMALEASGRPFVWVVRPPVGFDINAQFQPEWLPEGFEGRTRESKRGLLLHGWAPQMEILSHPSTGAFLSHCGWNSVLESLINAVPIIGWPLAAEQFYNVKFMQEEVGVCVEAARGNAERSTVRKEEIERAIEAVMEDRDVRRKAKEISQVLKAALKETSIKGLEEFFELAISKRTQS